MSTAISVGRDMKTLSLDELIGALRVHEVHLSKMDKIKGLESIALPAKEENKNNKGKTKALKVEAELTSEES